MADSELVWLIFTPGCFNSFIKFDIENFMNDGCAASVISKLLGYAIISGSFALKIPQIFKIMSAKSGAGLSVLGLIIESLGFLVTTAYFYRQGLILLRVLLYYYNVMCAEKFLPIFFFVFVYL